MIDAIMPYLVFTCKNADIQKVGEAAQGHIISGYRAGM